MDALIAAGAQLDLQNIGGYTAVMCASDLGQTETTVALINGGAQLDLQNDGGNTAVIKASYLGHTEITVALIMQGPSWTCRMMQARLR